MVAFEVIAVETIMSFHKTSDSVIVRLLDPERGFVMNCDLCRVHMKVEATGRHVCAEQTLYSPESAHTP